MMHLVPALVLALALLRVLAQLGSDLTDVLWGLAPEVGTPDWTLSASVGAVGVSSALLGVMWAASGAWLPAGLALVALLFVAAWPVVRWVGIRTGSYRAAYTLTRFDPLFWASDRVGGPLFAAAWAMLRGGATAEGRAWVEARLPTDRPLTPASVGAAALLALARGDRREAEAFLEAVDWFDPRIQPALLPRLCIELRVACAAARGAWDIAADTHPGDHPTGATELVQAVSRRLLGRPDAEDDDRMAVLWWFAPRLWTSARPWLSARRDPDPPAPDVDALEPLPAALALHRWLLAHPAPGADALDRVARAWDDALDGPLGAALLARAAELGARRSHDAPERLRAWIQDDLAEIARARVVPLPALTDSPTLGGVVARVRDEHLVTIELAAERLRLRLREERALPALDELREWLAVRALYEDGVRQGGESLRRLVFRPVYEPLCSLSVSLYNDRDQRWLSNALTRWLLAEARAVGDAPAVELQSRNLAAGG